MNIQERLIGAWKLESYTEYPVDGSDPIHPFGKTPEGYILYTPDGFMSAQLAKPNRELFATGDWFAGSDEEYRAQGSSYISYTGPYRIDEETGALSHVVEVSLFANWQGQTQPRTMRFEDDYLILGNTSKYLSGGKHVNAEIRWKRACRV